MKLLCLQAMIIASSSLFAQNSDSVKQSVSLGYNVANPDQITGAIFVQTRKNFNKGYIIKSEQLLQGNVAGLSVAKAGGNPNQEFYMRIRGLNTMYSNSQPLIVINGVPSFGLSNLDPNDIESVTVLKDAASCAVYGMRGNNGVIMITTRSGNESGTAIQYDGSVTAELVAKNSPVMSAESWRDFSKEIGLGTDYGANTDWYKEIERTAYSQRHSLAVGGNAEHTSWRFSVNYKDIKGVLKHSGFNQINSRLSINQTALKDNLRMNFNMAGTEQDINYSFSEAFHYATLYNPTAPVTSDDPEYKPYGGYFQKLFFDYYNPVSIIDQNKNNGKRRLLDVSLKTSLKIARFLSVDAFYAAQTDRLSGFSYYDRNEYFLGYNRGGIATRTQEEASSQLFESTLHINVEPLHSLYLNFHGGYSYQEFMNESLGASVSGFLTDFLTYNSLEAAQDTKKGILDINSYKSTHTMAAFFGIMNMNWKKWVLNAVMRYEGSSRLGENNKWALFPSIGAGFNWSKNLKLRMSYGITGNIPSGSYYSKAILQPNGLVFPYNNTLIPLYYLSSPANPNLGHERKKEFDAGIDFSFFDSKLTGNFDFYHAVASDLLIHQYYSQNALMWGYVWLNSGELENSGKELTLNYTVIDKPGFSYNISFNASWGLKNKLIKMTGTFEGQPMGREEIQGGIAGSPGACCMFLTEIKEGKPIGQLMGFILENIDETGRLVYKDMDENGYIDFLDYAVAGNGLPKSIIGLGQSLSYGKWNITALFRGIFGYHLINSNRLFYEFPSMLTTYNVPPTVRNMINETGIYVTNSGGTLLNKHVEKAGFIALDNLYISYNLSLPGINTATLYIAGNNLFYITRYKGADPNPRYVDEAKNYGDYNSVMIPGIDRRESWCRTRSFTFGIKVVL